MEEWVIMIMLHCCPECAIAGRFPLRITKSTTVGGTMLSPPATSLFGAATVAAVWFAHRRKASARAAAESGGGGPDPDDVDPIKWTGIEIMLGVPALVALGMACDALVMGGAGAQALGEAWAGLVASTPHRTFMRGAYAGFSLWYLGFGLAVLALDLTRWPEALYRLKCQPNANVDYGKMLPRLFAVLAGNVFLPWILFFGLPRDVFEAGELHVLDVAGRFVRISPDLPSLVEFTKDVAGFFMIYDVFFFWTHLLLHQPFFYARIHKLHHQWTAPTALAAAYAHPIEHVLSNVGPAAIAMVMFRPHFLSFVTFTWLGLTTTLCEHAGYEFLADAKFHDIHHLRYNCNYGLWGLYDDLLGSRMWPGEAYGGRRKSA